MVEEIIRGSSLPAKLALLIGMFLLPGTNVSSGNEIRKSTPNLISAEVGSAETSNNQLQGDRKISPAITDDIPADPKNKSTPESALNLIRRNLYPLKGEKNDFNLLIEWIGDARFVLMGESTHGTHEFYKARREITQRLIKEKGFTLVAIEAGWSFVSPVNRYIQSNDGITIIAALEDFKRYPSWVWRNKDTLELIQQLRDYNATIPRNLTKTGIYGFDLYGLYNSIDEVTGYLDKLDVEAAKRARLRYSCFDGFDKDPHKYANSVSADPSLSCESEAEEQFLELNKNAFQYLNGDIPDAQKEFFNAQQNARLIKNSEKYFRAVYENEADSTHSWNLRDRHMMEILEALNHYIQTPENHNKVVVWAHNSHVGNAEASAMSLRGELNIGQLLRKKYADKAVLIGFATHTGTVLASTTWGGPVEQMQLLPAVEGSYAALFHKVNVPSFYLILNENREFADFLNQERLQRAVGVIYLQDTELQVHYDHARLADQFDVVIYFDKTSAIEPLDKIPE